MQHGALSCACLVTIVELEADGLAAVTHLWLVPVKLWVLAAFAFFALAFAAFLAALAFAKPTLAKTTATFSTFSAFSALATLASALSTTLGATFLAELLVELTALRAAVAPNPSMVAVAVELDGGAFALARGRAAKATFALLPLAKAALAEAALAALHGEDGLLEGVDQDVVARVRSLG